MCWVGFCNWTFETRQTVGVEVEVLKIPRAEDERSYPDKVTGYGGRQMRWSGTEDVQEERVLRRPQRNQEEVAAMAASNQREVDKELGLAEERERTTGRAVGSNWAGRAFR